MKYVVIDIETTGVPGKDGPVEDLQILEFGAIIEDSDNPMSYDDIPKYNKIIRHDKYSGGAFAINMNARLFEILSDRDAFKGEGQKEYDAHHQIITIDRLAEDFFKFLYLHLFQNTQDEFDIALGPNYSKAPIVITPAGKNFDSFDRKFVELIPNWNQYVTLRHRTIDPTSMLIDWEKDEVPPGLNDCLKRVGLSKAISHKAVEDCWDTLQVIRQDYKNKK